MRLNPDDLAHLKTISDSLKLAFGLPLPMADQNELLAQLSVINDFISKHKPGGFFYASDGEVPHDMPLEVMCDLTARIRGTQEA